MRLKFRTPQDLAELSQTEKFSLNVPKTHLNQLKRIAKTKNLPVSDLVNEAIRAYCEFLGDSKKDSGS
jgi:hypothetical protein